MSSALDIIGDKWSLVIIRDLMFFEKKTFKELSNSFENIATNILASRLKKLEEKTELENQIEHGVLDVKSVKSP